MMSIKVWFVLAANTAVFALLLFGGAGTLAWPAAWVYVAMVLVASVLICRSLARNDPELLKERMRWPLQREQPQWDRRIMTAFLLSYPLWLVLIGLDVQRFGWSSMPLWAKAIGMVGVAMALAMCSRVFGSNSFLSPVVKIQTARGHRVVSSGPYAVIRHPLYAAVSSFFIATPLMLGSGWGLVGSVFLIALLVRRTALEDCELHRRLEGYANYAAQVRFRLVPGIW
jgi:protein-S-isoprenylcysteine O-methyltransferase Ste14